MSEDGIIHISRLETSHGEVYADIDDLLKLLWDAKEHTEKYNKEVIAMLIKDLIGKEVEWKIEKPF